MTVALAYLLADLNGHMDGWGAGAWVLMALGMIGFWALVILGIVWLVRTLGGEPARSRAISATEVLERRLAEGDISVDEYRQRRDALGGTSLHASG